MYYLTTILIAIFACIASESINKNFSALVGFFWGCAIIIVSSFNGGMGSDYETYTLIFSISNDFEQIVFKGEKWQYEPLFGLSVGIAKSFGLDFREFHFIYNSVSLWILFFGLKKVTPNRSLALFIYFSSVFFIGHITLIRQAVVLALIPIFIYLLSERRASAFIFLAILGTLFHYSGAIVLVVGIAYLCVPKNKTEKWVSRLVITGILTILLAQFTSFLQVFSYMETFLPLDKSRIEHYANAMDHYQTSAAVILIKNIRIVLVGGVGLVFYKIIKSKLLLTSVTIYWLGVIMYSLASFSHLFASRIFLIFDVSSIIFLSYAYKIKGKKCFGKRIGKSTSLIIFFGVIFYSLVLFIYFVVIRYPYQFFPPKFWWSV